MPAGGRLGLQSSFSPALSTSGSSLCMPPSMSSHKAGFLTFLGLEMAGLFTVYVDNLPKSMDVGRLRQLFTPFGRVEDVYMPSKRSSSFNTKFGIIRFKRREEAINAIEDLDGVVIRNFTIVVQFAKYSKDNPIASQKNFAGVKKIISAPFTHSLQPKPIEFQSKQRDPHYSSSYANILKGGSSG
ncbi:hypothetical protein RHMOL_Rhmol13G0138900 [Rhododendron molle]|uniref:Uncharacterized protein n=1 Tax=Rhododendron molle TaxID=49168 RepID=A0ACC0L6K9_RHOML|nr:hypothetical protein RHMOL_Rhmol13G0138900 [Rhododendron molle]